MNKGKLHIGTKLIFSTVMTLGDYNKYRGWTIPEDQNPLDEGYLVEYMDGGKANHPDHKGYISWSPKEVHDNNYQDVTKGVSFGAATQLAKAGYKVARSGWNGAKMHAWVDTGGARVKVSDGEALLNMRPHWLLKTAQNDVVTWAPSGSDSLSDDWVIVE